MSKVIIIAEAGVNHNGDIQKAYELIDVAEEAGVDYVKFQSFKADRLVSKDAKKRIINIINTKSNDNSQYAMLKQLELSEQDHLDLISYCNKKYKFFSTAFDDLGVDYLDSLGLNLFKIPSGELTNFPYLRSVAIKKKPVLLSTGMASLSEIQESLNVLIEFGLRKDQITIMHCNTEYPTPMKDVNLKAMITIKEKFGVAVGYSDHTLGVEVPIAAVAMGAQVIEKHFTLDRNLQGPDHKASLEPNELKEMTTAIRNIELATSGDGVKKPSQSEQKNIHIARKSIHLTGAYKKGELIHEDDMIALRPGDGISPMKWNDIVGKKMTVDTKPYHKLTKKRFSMKIGILTSSRADYGIYFPLLKELKTHNSISLEIIAFGTHLSKFHGYTLDSIKKDNYSKIHQISSLLSNDDEESIATSYGLTVLKFCEFWSSNTYDLVFCLVIGLR